MTKRDFDESDAEVLAEFAGLEIFKVGEEEVIVEHPKTNGIPIVFQPWSYKASQWQIQSCLDAVREKGLEREFGRNLYYKIHSPEVIEMAYSYREGDSGTAEINFKGITNVASAPPEAICSAILSVEGE